MNVVSFASHNTNQINFIVNSTHSGGKYYIVSIKNTNNGNTVFECTCGFQYGLSIRNQCKHIHRVVYWLTKTYKSNYSDNIGVSAGINNDLSLMFNNIHMK